MQGDSLKKIGVTTAINSFINKGDNLASVDTTTEVGKGIKLNLSNEQVVIFNGLLSKTQLSKSNSVIQGTECFYLPTESLHYTAVKKTEKSKKYSEETGI